MAKSVKKINPMVEDVIKRAEKELGNKFVQVEENLWQLRKVENMEWKPEFEIYRTDKSPVKHEVLVQVRLVNNTVQLTQLYSWYDKYGKPTQRRFTMNDPNTFEFIK